MKLADLIPDPDALLALEPDELGLRMLPLLTAWRYPGSQLQASTFIASIVGARQDHGYAGQYPADRRSEIDLALREAWAWLEGEALLIADPAWVEPHTIRMLSRRARQLAKHPDPLRAFSARRIPKDS